MATSSINKNFVISGKEQVEIFADAMEASANDCPVRTPINLKFIETEELREFMRFRGMNVENQYELVQLLRLL